MLIDVVLMIIAVVGITLIFAAILYIFLAAITNA